MVSKVLEAGRRARQDRDKDIRRETITAAALRLFETVPFARLTMAEVAAEAGIAKGTVYLYYPTKEALFLELLDAQFEDWFAALHDELRQPSPADANDSADAAFVDWLIASLEARPLFLRLIALLHTVLEHNIAFDAALRFKRMLARHVVEAGSALAARLKLLDAAAGARLLLWLHALSIGLQHMAAPAPMVQRAMAHDPGLTLFDITLGPELRSVLTPLLAGLPRHTQEITG